MHSGSQPAAAAALTDRVEMAAVGSMKVRKAYNQCSTVGSGREHEGQEGVQPVLD